jgi:hypothetical protein
MSRTRFDFDVITGPVEPRPAPPPSPAPKPAPSSGQPQQPPAK